MTTLDEIFDLIAKGIKADPTIAEKVKGSFLFKINQTSGPALAWLLDLKTSPGTVTKTDGKADVTITTSEESFMQLVSGKLSGQQAVMQGKITLAGPIAMAMKIQQIFAAAKPKDLPAKAASGSNNAKTEASQQNPLEWGGPPTVPSSLSSIFEQIKKKIESTPSLSSINGSFQFRITTSQGQETWIVDLKKQPGTVKRGEEKADCTISMKQEDFVSLMLGTLNGMDAWTKGLLKVEGNMGLAMKLQSLKISPDSKL
eukprot:TRINITY_DN10695_c0_g1_i1.p1 TRINITY_DN10695_c0_g1~~TRINITY_DN10695_c0_g1_i1.p1  ORF type:complete len:257 (+),score=59.89 TRINITY_DN10695_c0_g1_i1:52-822(+)